MKTIIQLFDESIYNYRTKTFLWEKNDQKFKSLTYGQTKERVYQLASGLLELGIKSSDKIALLSEGRSDWIISELAILHLGAVNVPLSVKLEESNDLYFRLKHSDAKYIIVSGTQLKKIRAIIEDLPLVEKVIVMDKVNLNEDREILYEEICREGKEKLIENQKKIEDIAKSVNGSDLANISYTSGTTADPKGIMLSHRNYTANVEQAMSLIEIDTTDSNLIILPLDHCFAHVAGFYTFMAYGANVATVQRGKSPMDTLRNIPLNMKEFQPTVIMSVPALAKNFRKNIETSIKAKGESTVKLFNKALQTAYEYNREGYNKKKSLITKIKLKVYDKLIFSKVREAFGGKLKFFIGGGALLDIELQRFFYAIGVPMLQGYGLSEATPIISANSIHRHKLGSSGFIVKNLDLKICDEDGNELPVGEKGEIVVKGENVMLGYWKNEQATKETIKDGWLYTGDMGYVDSDGFLYVLGRFKSLLISSDGEKYNPEGIEESVVEKVKFIDQIVLHNNQDAYTVALVVPNIVNLKEYIQKEFPGLSWTSREAKIESLNAIKDGLDQYKAKGIFAGEFPERWLPAAIAVLPEPFTEQNGMVNSTTKIVRSKVEEFYQDRLEYLYMAEGKNHLSELNMESLK
ncbi:MAG: AMP-binding protein [Prevotella sp.]|jgi:long-chain acyl-CoA synthetase|nr:AMP-binding protein [Prevotella sp.]